jgi:acyl-CoA synthetase (NDP forming)
MLDVRAATGLPCYVITNLPEGAPKHVRDMLLAHDIVPLQGMEDAFSCIGRAARYVARMKELAGQGGAERRIVGTGALAADRMLDETESKGALAAHGVAVPDSRLAGDAETAALAALELGFPVVVKGHGATLAHKSELGAVAVNLKDEAAVRDATEAMLGIPGVERVLVEAMVTDAVAEMIVGIKRDPVLGLALVLGSGGVLSELLKDSVNLILPASEAEIRRAIGRLRGVALLNGFRGKPEGDVDALVTTAMNVAAYAMAHADRLMELDVNPVMVRPRGKGAVAVDALIRLGTPA